MKRALLLALVASLATGAPALACSIIVIPAETYPEHMKRARESIDWADIIVDGEVIRTWSNTAPAQIKVVRVFKGSAPKVIDVDYDGACDRPLDAMGERNRFGLRQGRNGRYYVFELYDPRYLDRALKSDRRKVWPYRPGAIAAAP